MSEASGNHGDGGDVHDDMGRPATIIMSVADVQGAALVGPITPAAALTLGARLASAVTDGAFSPAGVRVDRDGEVHQGPSPLPPHYQRDHEPEGGLYLLELSLGRTVDDDAVLVRGELSGLVDENGRPLAPRLSDVLSAMLAPTPESRLQGFLPVRRVCAKAAAAFGGAVAGQKGLKQAAVEAMTKPLKATKDLPARAILGSADLRRLRGSTPTVIMPVRATPLPGSVLANAPSSPWPPLKDVAGVVAATPAAHSAGYGVQPGDSDGGPIDSALNGDAAAAASAEGGASDDAGTTDADADDLAAAGLASTSRRRGPLLVVAVVVVALVVVAIAVVATR